MHTASRRTSVGTAAALALALVLAAALALACGGEGEPGPDAAPAPTPVPDPPVSELPIATVEVEDFGAIRVALLPHKAPETVATFVERAGSGYYEGTTFHRVVPGFMIQGGDPNSRDRDPRNDGMGGPSEPTPDEFNDTPFARGVVAMAHRGQPGTAGSQFFITVADRPELDGRYTAFGRVITGMDVVDRIAAVERDLYARWGPQDRPREDVVISRITVQRPAAASESDEGDAAPGAGE